MSSQVSGEEVLCGWVNVVPKSIPSYGVLSFPFICQGAEVGSTRERLPVSRFSSSLRVVPAGAVDDDGVVPAPPPGATCDMCLNRVGVRGPPACLVGDVRPDKIGGVSPRRVLRLDLWCGGRPGLAIMACPLQRSCRGMSLPTSAPEVRPPA
jgi:hypothetical protein